METVPWLGPTMILVITLPLTLLAGRLMESEPTEKNYHHNLFTNTCNRTLLEVGLSGALVCDRPEPESM